VSAGFASFTPSSKGDPKELAALRDPNCKNSEQTIAKALMGNYRDEHLFALGQALELFEEYGKKLKACDQKIASALVAFEKKSDRANLKKKLSTRRKNQPRFDATHELSSSRWPVSI
jgi:transposase